MDNYKKIKSIMLQLQILGDGAHDDVIAQIQAKLSAEPYTATNETLIYANTLLNDVIQKEDKKKLKKLAKLTEMFGGTFTSMDEADDFINNEKIKLQRGIRYDRDIEPLVVRQRSDDKYDFIGVL